ncbi:MAG: hypothetical protein IT165_05415 [Bryobacterales bacterium]|nr:hypothetical protein [Bryobacterales bacterium]
MTVVETPSFLRDAASRLTVQERIGLVSFLAFSKNEKANLSKAERNDLRQLAPRLIAGYHKKVTK